MDVYQSDYFELRLGHVEYRENISEYFRVITGISCAGPILPFFVSKVYARVLKKNTQFHYFTPPASYVTCLWVRYSCDVLLHKNSDLITSNIAKTSMC